MFCERSQQATEQSRKGCTVSGVLPVFPTFKTPKHMNPHILYLLKENVSILFSIHIIFNAKEFWGVETNQKNKHNNLMPVSWNFKLMSFLITEVVV